MKGAVGRRLKLRSGAWLRPGGSGLRDPPGPGFFVKLLMAYAFLPDGVNWLFGYNLRLSQLKDVYSLVGRLVSPAYL